ncbi:serine protein kinase [Candidatus Parcubacteria bacterium]|nr:MAG: serine protein kinase [Candidatus Parcubacteria bacterium]
MADLSRKLLDKYAQRDYYKDLVWTGNFHEYLDLVRDCPSIVRNAHQRVYDMVVSPGHTDYTKFRQKMRRWKFFDDAQDGGKDAVYGIDTELNSLVQLLKAAAEGYGVERRILLLHGPVGSSKSTIARLLKKGLERYSRTKEGALYTFQIFDVETEQWVTSPMHEEPLKLIPEEVREDFVRDLFADKTLPFNLTSHRGTLDPASRKYFNIYMDEFKGDWQRILDERVRIRRLVISEKDRVGIGTYQPKDEKSQDATELTGDINYRKIAQYGSDSDPRAFNFDGEFNVANRGIIEFIEVLKLETAFLYDLLGATQEKKIKPRKFAQTDIDEVIIGHTNNPEYRKLVGNDFMEALRDRTIKVDVGYNLELTEEIKIYERDFAKPVKHIAPHTIRVAAMWAILTRLKEPKDSHLNLMQKLKLYDGKTLPGYTIDNVQELRTEGRESAEGMDGISPRFIQDKLSAALADDRWTHINPFIVMNAIRDGLGNNALVGSNKDFRQRCEALLDLAKEEYTDIVKNEVQRAICADEDAISRLCANYVDNVKAYCQKEKMKNKYTGQDEEPDEGLMRSIEEKIEIPKSRKDDFRRELMNYIGALAVDGKKFHYWNNERLQKALELKLFEDRRNTINLSTMMTDVVDADTQSKIDVVKARLIKNYGYNEESAQDVLNYVASIFVKGDPKSQG